MGSARAIRHWWHGRSRGWRARVDEERTASAVASSGGHGERTRVPAVGSEGESRESERGDVAARPGTHICKDEGTWPAAWQGHHATARAGHSRGRVRAWAWPEQGKAWEVPMCVTWAHGTEHSVKNWARRPIQDIFPAQRTPILLQELQSLGQRISE
jgi:hypothetical protein